MALEEIKNRAVKKSFSCTIMKYYASKAYA